MDCPLCKVKLHMSERQGIEIDYCPECRGIWLDRGELEKLIQRSASNNRSHRDEFEHSHDSQSKSYSTRPNKSDLRRRDDKDYERRRPKKRDSWFEEIFDIFD